MAFSEKLISIIIPCFNQARFLDECLQSVLDQTYFNWECIIINDGSNDNTEEIAKRWIKIDKRFKYIFKKNGGLSSARNVGLEMANGDFIQLLDSDDKIERRKLEFQISYMISNPDVDISISGYRYFDNYSEERKILGRDNFLPEVVLTKYDQDVKEIFILRNPMVVSAPLYKIKVIETVGKFDENLSALEDWHYNFRCALYNFTFEHIGYHYETKTLIRLHNQSMMSDVKTLKIQMEFFKEYFSNDILFRKYFGDQNDFNKKEILYKSSIKFKAKKNLKLFFPPIIFEIIKICRKIK